MAINACTINGFTLHARRCASQWERLIPVLHPFPPGGDGGAGGAAAGNKYAKVPQYAPYEIDDRPDLTFEQPFITVSVEILGFSGVDTQEVSAMDTDFVSVSDFSVGEKELIQQVGVNITNLRIE